MTKTMKFTVGAGVSLLLLFFVSTFVQAQSAPTKTVVSSTQVFDPTATFTAFRMITQTGTQFYRPKNGSIVIDDVAKTIEAIATIPSVLPVPLDQLPIVVSVLDPTVPSNRDFLVPAVPAANSLVVFRNGLENYATIDFTVAATSPNSVTVTYPAGILGLGDTIAIRYKK